MSKKTKATVRTAAGKVTVEPASDATIADVIREANRQINGPEIVFDTVAFIQDGRQVTAETPVGDAEETTITVAPQVANG